MNIHLDTTKPRVHVFSQKDKDLDPVIEQICLGIEEEGIPYAVEKFPRKQDAVHLGYQAAVSSRLGVGIGVGDEVVLHYIKLKEDQPLFVTSTLYDENVLRDIGSNAARLIKRMPFKNIED